MDEAIAIGQEGVRIADPVERGLGLAQEWNLTLLSPPITECLGHVYVLSGRVAEDLLVLLQALKALESIGLNPP